jgi:predicted O-linked N-acetylglucosamine transferase (SPINDLY family)
MSDENLEQTLELAIAHHQAGQLLEAQSLFLRILEHQPDHPETHHSMGKLAVQLQQLDIGLMHFFRALCVKPQEEKYWRSVIEALVQTDRHIEARELLQQGKTQLGLQGPVVVELEKMLATPAAEDINILFLNFQQGQTVEGERNARRLLAHFPEYGLAWKALGLFLQQRNAFPEALEAQQRAIELLPDDAEAHMNYASSLQGQGKLTEAISCYEKALELDPQNSLATGNLGTVLFNLGRYDEAERYFAKSVTLTPGSIGELINLGLCQQARRHPDQAEQSFRLAITLQPTLPQSHYCLAIALKIQNRLSEAAACCRQALFLEPSYPEAFCALGSIHFAVGDFTNAKSCFEQALAIKPNDPEALNNLGTTHQVQRHWLEAEYYYRQAISLSPNYVDAHTNLGINLQSQGRIAEAEECWQTSLKLNPDQIATQSGLLFHLNYSARFGTNYLEEARKFGRMVAAGVNPFNEWRCADRPTCLRVGLVSGDLRDHPVGHFLYALLRESNSSRVEFIAYATQPSMDHYSTLLRPYLVDWKNIDGLTDQASANLIHADGVHILVDLAGHSSHNRLSLFAWKPAPIQISWLGYLASTGVEAIDYILSDPYSILPQDEQNYSERIWRMPDSCICFTATDPATNAETPPLLNQGFVTFGSFNNLTKMTDSVVATWARILRNVPGSKLLIKASQLNEPILRNRTLHRFGEQGIGADRLILAETTPSRAEHLSMYNKVDIALDTFPYPGVTTSVEALSMGIPVLTLRGDGILARAGESICMNAGLAEWIAADEEDYVRKAQSFAQQTTELLQLRKHLREQVLESPLFDSTRFATNYEEALWQMWEHQKMKH